MEHKKAFDFLIKKTKSMNFKELATHIKKVGPLKIKTSNMKFVDHLVKIIVGQQLSVKSAAAIWERTEKILNESNYKKPLNNGNPNEFTIKELAEIVIEKINPRLEIAYLPLPQDDPLQRKPDIALAKKALSWEPKININEGLNRTIPWFKQEISKEFQNK